MEPDGAYNYVNACGDCMKKEDKIILIKAVILVIVLLALVVIAAYFLPKVVPTWGSAQIINERLLPIYCVETEEKKVALSFDAAWGNEDTQEILSILAEEGVHVTFFMTGGWVSKYPDDVKSIAEAGHDLGNHGENHLQMSTLTVDQCTKEIKSVHEKVKELTGIEMTLFRPPYGDYNDNVINAATGQGYQVVQWDVDSLDWKDYGVDSIINTVCNHKHLGCGSIILMHNGATYTPEALRSVIQGLKDQGYEIVPISELVIPGTYQKDYDCDHEGRQYSLSEATK